MVVVVEEGPPRPLLLQGRGEAAAGALVPEVAVLEGGGDGKIVGVAFSFCL